MRLFNLSVLLALLPLSAHASLEGRYSGQGSALMHASGRSRKCSEIFLDIRQTQEAFQLLQGGYVCEDLQASFTPFVLTIKDGKIYSDSNPVGTIGENFLDLFYANEDEDYTYHWSLQKNGERLDYLEEWTSGGKPTLSVGGSLGEQR